MAGVNKNFVVKNGLEVNNDLIFANATNDRVGINTNDMKYALHVNGGIGVTNLYTSGIGTFNSIHLAGSVTAGTAGAGSTGQYLVRVGSGVSWQNLPSTRSSQTFTATAGQTVFLFSYTVGQLDVFINGVKLSPSEYTANDTASVILNTACFGDETVELISYSSVNPGYGFTGIYGISLFEEGSPVGTTGQVVALNFVGAAVTSTATGIAATVYLTENWTKNSQGVYSLNSVGIGTTNPRFALEVGAVGASGTSLWVNGNARVTGILTVGSSSIVLDGSNNTINVGSGITINGNTGIVSASNFYANGLQVGVITASTIIYQGATLNSSQWVTTATGIHTLGNVGIGTTNATAAVTSANTTVLAAGIVTAYKFYGDGSALTGISGGGTSSQWVTTAAGIHTLSSVGIGTTNPTSALTVKGNTSLETLNVSGVVTFATNSGGSISIDNNGNMSFADWQVGGYNILRFGDSNDLNIYHDGTKSIISETGTGNLWVQTSKLDIVSSGSEYMAEFVTDGAVNLYYDNAKKFETTGAGVTVTGTTFTDQLSVSGVSTFVGNAVFQSNINLGDNDTLYFGGNNALSISSPGTIGGGGAISGGVNLYDWLIISSANGGNTVAKFRPTIGDGSDNVELYYGGVKKFQTIGAGVTVTGTTFTDQLSVSGVSTFVGLTTFKNYVTITELGNSNYDGIRFVSGSNFAIVSSDPLGNLIINSQSTNNRYAEINGYSQFYANSGNVQLNNGNQGTTKVGSAITFTSNTGEIFTTGNARVGVSTAAGVILTSPNGTKYQLFVENDGTLKTVAV